jgi:uncharacterized metal-binding protein YceD (DUF177 family)
MDNFSLKTLKIGGLWMQPAGSTEKYAIDEAIDFDGNFTLASNYKADFTLFKLKNSLSALFTDVETDVIFDCTHCLEKFTAPMFIESMEREYVYDRTETDFDPYEHFLIDKKDLTIDIHEMIRQEIILHFPLIPVCSEGCKGLCIECGKNLNKEENHPASCGVKMDEDEPNTHKPFANLKNLLNNN